MAPSVYRVPAPGGVLPGVRGGVRYGRRHPSLGRGRALAQAARPLAAAGPAPAFAPGSPFPTLPTGSYNPQRDVEVEEGERGLGQLEGQAGTSRTRDLADYAQQRAQLETRGHQQDEDFSRAQQQLSQAFQRLAGRQEEGANLAGVLGGGALLQSAAKRAASEGQQSQAQRTAYGRAKEGTSRSLALLERELAPPSAENPTGGRRYQDLATQLANAGSNQVFFQSAQQRLAGQEAAERGYTVPQGAQATGVVGPGGVPRRTYRSGRAWVRVGGR